MNEKGKEILKIENDCYLIDKGVRSCTYSVIVGVELLNELETIAINHNLHIYFYQREVLNKNKYGSEVEHYDVWIYKFHHQLAIIKYIESRQGLNDYLVEWIKGKLLGYSDKSIEDYLSMLLIDEFVKH